MCPLCVPGPAGSSWVRGAGCCASVQQRAALPFAECPSRLQGQERGLCRAVGADGGLLGLGAGASQSLWVKDLLFRPMHQLSAWKHRALPHTRL